MGQRQNCHKIPKVGNEQNRSIIFVARNFHPNLYFGSKLWVISQNSFPCIILILSYYIEIFNFPQYLKICAKLHIKNKIDPKSSLVSPSTRWVYIFIYIKYKIRIAWKKSHYIYQIPFLHLSWGKITNVHLSWW